MIGVGAASTPGPWCPRSNQFGGRVHFWPAHRLANHLIGDPTLRSLIGSLLAFTRPIFPLPGSPVWFGSALGFTPLLSHASLPGACRGQGQDWTLSRAVTTSHVYSIWFRAASRRNCAGVSGECRVLLRKPLRENDIGKNGPACQDRGLPNDPFPARRPHRCGILTQSPFAHRRVF